MLFGGPRLDLNQQPADYESVALPLSYGALALRSGLEPETSPLIWCRITLMLPKLNWVPRLLGVTFGALLPK